MGRGLRAVARGRKGCSMDCTMDDVLQLDQILNRFRQNYVLLDRCRFDPRKLLTHGRVLHSSTDRDGVYSALRKHPNSVVIFTGEPHEELDGAFLALTCSAPTAVSPRLR